MGLYGVTKYGSPRKWGYGGMPAAVDGQRAAIGGQAPWMGDFTIPWRNACVRVATVDPVTWADATELPALGVGGQRAATLENGRYQRETLTLVLNDPAAYLPDGAYASLVAPNTLLRPTWTVSSPGGALTFPGTVYSVQSAPQRDDDVLGGSPLALTAVDFLDPLLAQGLYPSGYFVLADLADMTAVALIDGMPPVGTGNVWFAPTVEDVNILSIATIIAALLWQFAVPGATALVLDPAWAAMDLITVSSPTPALRASAPPGSEAAVPAAIPGTPATVRDVLDFLWAYEPFTLTYTASGFVALHPGTGRRASGWVVSRDATVGGVLALPWETLTRNPRQAAFTGLTYRIVTNDPTGAVEGGGGDFGEFGATPTPPAFAASTSSVNPYASGRIKTLTDRTPSVWPFFHQSEYARYLLARELGQADPISLTLDSAYPVVELGGEVRVCDPPRADGWWQIVGVQQPYAEGAQTLTLEWREDA